MKIKAGTQELLIKDKMVIRFQAEGEMTTLYLENGRSMILEENIKSIESQLTSSSFIRIHSEHLVNVDHIARIPEHESDGITLSDDTCIPVGSKSLLQLKEIIENHINP